MQSINGIQYVIAVLFFMLSWRLLFDLESKRYFLPTVIPTLVLAAFGIVSLVAVFGKIKYFNSVLYVLFFLFVVGTIANYFYVGRQADKHKSILAVAESIRSDFLKNSYRNVVIISNSKEAGRFLHYSNIRGNYCLEENVDKIQTLVDQMLFQYDAVYVVFQRRFDGRNPLNELNIKCFHSYEMISFPDEIVNPKNQKGYSISKIVSQSVPSFGPYDGLCSNGSFRFPGTQTLDSPRLVDFPFFNNKPQVQFPQDWRINFNHTRGFDFSDWKFDYSQTDTTSKLIFYSTGCGISIYNTQRFMPDDYYLIIHAVLTPDAAISLFLYGYDSSSKYFVVQSVGYLTPQSDSNHDCAFFIRSSDLPDSMSFFRIGFISLGEQIQIDRIDLVPALSFSKQEQSL